MMTPMTTLNCCHIPGTVDENFVVVASSSDGNQVITEKRQDIMPHFQSCINITDYPENQTMVVVEANSTLLPNCNISICSEPSPVNDVRVGNQTNSSVILLWQTPADCCLMASAMYPSVGYRNFTADISDLLPGQAYTMTVYRTLEGCYSNGTTINVTTLPNSPRNICITKTSTNSVSISWDPPDDQNAPRYLYRVSWFLGKEGPLENRTINGTNCTIDGLQPGCLYLVTVASDISGVNSAEETKWILTAPLTPVNFRLQNINQTVAEFTWKPPNSTISGYKLQWKNSTESTENEMCLKNNSTEAVLTWLTPSTNYTFTLLSLVKRKDLVTHSSSIQLMGATKPERINDVRCRALPGGSELKLSWTCPSREVSKFQVLVSGQIWETWLTQCKDSIVIHHLQPARSYGIQVETFWYSQSAISESVKCFTDNTGVIVGPLVAMLLFLIILGLLVFYFKRWRRKPNSTSEKQKSDVDAPGVLTSVSVSAFPCYCSERFSSSALGFAKEYQQLQDVGIGQTQAVAEQPENQAKNRYSNVLPYDHSRVQLTLKPGDPNSDYINASYMPGFQGEKEFIAAQGPLRGTLHDFWRMIWEQRITTLVMLTKCVENGRVKCERYWPLDYTPCTYDDITVSVVRETILPNWTIRDFNIKRLNESEVRLARHHHYTSWPDHGVPPVTNTVLHFRDLVREHIEQHEESGPALIHCSAGVGRTGTFIALDSLLRQAQDNGEIGVFSFVQRLRMNRPLMIQTESQYIFLHQCLLDGMEATRQHDSEKVECSAVYENTLALQEYEVSRV
ncbi:receptor-type tyrosine-protein phosphatase H [Pogona vitticeps]